MINSLFRGLSTLLIITVLSSVGCGESTPGGYVTGKVLYNGKPVDTGTRIYFEQSNLGVLAAGVVDDDGSFSLNYRGSAKIPLGDYVVYVGPADNSMTEKEFRELKRKVDAEYRSRGEEPPPSPDWVLPPQFYLAETSSLRQTIEQGENVVDVVLSD